MPAMGYSVSFVVPGKSPGLLCDEDGMHFSSTGCIFSSARFVHIGEDVLILRRMGEYYVAATESRLYVVLNKIVARLNRKATAVSVTNRLIAIGTRHTVEIWVVRFKDDRGKNTKPFFHLVASLPGHAGAITGIAFIGGHRLVSTSADGTTRAYTVSVRGGDAHEDSPSADLSRESTRRGCSRIIASHKTPPVGAFCVSGCLAVVARGGVVTFFDEDMAVANKAYLNGDVVSADGCGEAVAVLLRTAKREDAAKAMLLVLVYRDGLKKSVEVEDDITEISANKTQVALKGGAIYIYDSRTCTLVRHLDLVEPTCICEYQGWLGVGCADFAVRIYEPFWRSLSEYGHALVWRIQRYRCAADLER